MSRTMSLQDAATRLGVHYMTAYRYVRTGRLPAEQSPDGTWIVESSALTELLRQRRQGSARRGGSAHGARVHGLTTRILAGDEPGAWSLLEAALTSGATAGALHLTLLAPAMRAVGDAWERGDIDVAEEHRATAVMQRLVGRMGPLLARRGRPRGSIIIGAPEGERHGLPCALATNLLRGAGFVVMDLGPDVPTISFVECVRRMPRLSAVCVSVTAPRRADAATALLNALRDVRPGVPVLAGGAGITEQEAIRSGASAWGRDGADLLRLVAPL